MSNDFDDFDKAIGTTMAVCAGVVGASAFMVVALAFWKIFG